MIKDWPPNIDHLDQVFHLRAQARLGIIFSWGADKIYNPSGVVIPPALYEHEAVHGRRQDEAPSIEIWWQRYVDDPKFRLMEEVLAHCREYGFRCGDGSRAERRQALADVSKRLASSLYGRMISRAEARRILQDSMAAP